MAWGLLQKKLIGDLDSRPLYRFAREFMLSLTHSKSSAKGSGCGMRRISFSRRFNGWFSTNDPTHVRDHSDSLSINFRFGQELSQRDVRIALQRVVQEEGFDWLRQRGKFW